jgi:hypothetical protein
MWTKAELAKLTVEQQEVLARFELSIARQRQKLLEEARGYRGSFLRNVGIAALIGIPLGAIFLFVFFAPRLDGNIVCQLCSRRSNNC